MDGTRVLADNGNIPTWLTPSQIAYVQGEGYYVLSDKEINQHRAELQASMPPSITEVLAPQVVAEITAGTYMKDLHRFHCQLATGMAFLQKSERRRCWKIVFFKQSNLKR